MIWHDFNPWHKVDGEWQQVPKESPLNTPEVACQHCSKATPIREAVACAADGRLFCSIQCRAASEIFNEWQDEG